MVSNARLDLPEPESPVTTIRLSRASSSDTFFRLWTRAPCTAMVVRGATFAMTGFGLELIGNLRDVEKSQLLHIHIALFGEPHRQRRLAEEPLVSQILAYPGHAADAEVALEVVFNFGCRARLAHFSQVLDHWAKQQRRALSHVAIDGR